jgi:lipopolysaccharide biosynthesis protein
MSAMFYSAPTFLTRLIRLARVMILSSQERNYLRAIRKSGMFDPVYYRGAYPKLNPMYRRFPEKHYIAYGENMGFRPNPDFSPFAYLRYNTDVADQRMRPFRHYIEAGHRETRITKEMPDELGLPDIDAPVLRFDPDRPHAPQAVVVHIYYRDLWDEIRSTLARLDIAFDLFVTVTWKGEETLALKSRIETDFPDARVFAAPNKGRDILPFLTLVNAGAFTGYRAVAKLHTKKSPHRTDGDLWRRHLIDGILPKTGLAEKLDAFAADPDAAFWVADGQHFTGQEWWGSNLERTRQVLSRVEITMPEDVLSFPAGSIYWIKPLMLSMLRALNLQPELFEPETAQVDGTMAHAVERVLGFLALAAGQRVLEASQVGPEAANPVADPRPPALRPALTSAFYLPQFYPTHENDVWWGKGYTEWRAAVATPACFTGHLQPMLPADLGFYDLRATEVMGEQTALARKAGIDAFCVYHYWFDGRRVLEAPLDRLLTRPEIDFPFYLCWANESWRRNWDGLSGEVLLEQTYADGFEAALARDVARYMRDPRYMRPDGLRPRFVIYRPEDMPDPETSLARLRDGFRAEGLGEVELGAVSFHISGDNPVAPDLVDFWIEMPPHGLIEGPDYLFGGPQGNLMPAHVNGRFTGLIYDYTAAAARALGLEYLAKLPANTIAGLMPSWDNSARRGLRAHIAHAANPASFRVWLSGLLRLRIAGSYRHELFVNAWNEWAEKAVMEPSQTFGSAYLAVMCDEFAAARPVSSGG